MQNSLITDALKYLRLKFVLIRFYSKINPTPNSSANSSNVGIKKADIILAYNAVPFQTLNELIVIFTF